MENGEPAWRAKLIAECVDLRTWPSWSSAMTRMLLMVCSSSFSESLGFGLELLDELGDGLDLDAGLAGRRQLERAVLDLEGGIGAHEVGELHLDERLLLRRHDGHEGREADAVGVRVRVGGVLR